MGRGEGQSWGCLQPGPDQQALILMVRGSSPQQGQGCTPQAQHAQHQELENGKKTPAAQQAFQKAELFPSLQRAEKGKRKCLSLQQLGKKRTSPEPKQERQKALLME